MMVLIMFRGLRFHNVDKVREKKKKEKNYYTTLYAYNN